MKRPVSSLTQKQYDMLKSTGMFFEIYPEATGNYRIDVREANENQDQNQD